MAAATFVAGRSGGAHAGPEKIPSEGTAEMGQIFDVNWVRVSDCPGDGGRRRADILPLSARSNVGGDTASL